MTCLISGLGGLELLAAELRSLAGRGEGKLTTREGEAGPQSARKSQSKSLILRVILQFASLFYSSIHVIFTFFSFFSPRALDHRAYRSCKRHINIENLHEKCDGSSDASTTKCNVGTGNEKKWNKTRSSVRYANHTFRGALFSFFPRLYSESWR